MWRMEINIRKAQPEDVRSVYPMVYSSGPHEFDYVFNAGNKTFKDFFHFAFPGELGLISYRTCTVATVNDEVVGIGAFTSGSERFSLDLGNVWNVARFYGLGNILKIARASSHLDTILPPPKSNELYIGQLGVKEGFRSKGIGGTLIRQQLELAKTKGLRKCVLDVATTNIQAQKLYERLGFKVAHENKWNFPDSHVPGQFRMELAL
jgi:ribosomal protein S18 acetylase RimI-like enzyme